MRLNEKKFIILTVCITLILLALFPFFIPYLPDRHRDFMSLAVLGENGKTEGYFQSSSIQYDQSMNWSINVINHRNELAYVSIKVKILSDSMTGPNSINCEASPEPALYEINRILSPEEEWDTTFQWGVTRASDNSSWIVVNSLPVDHQLGYSQSGRYRIVFELWTFEKSVNDFSFGWKNDDEFECVWNQIWFNFTSPS